MVWRQWLMDRPDVGKYKARMELCWGLQTQPCCILSKYMTLWALYAHLIFKNFEKIHCLIPLCCAIGHNAVLSKLISNFSLSFLHRLQTSRSITLIPLFILFIYMYYIFMHFLPVSGEYSGHYYPYIFIKYSTGINYKLCLKTHQLWLKFQN